LCQTRSSPLAWEFDSLSWPWRLEAACIRRTARALAAVIGGPAVLSAGYVFPFLPVALNSILLVALGAAFHKLSRRSYPRVPAPAPSDTHHTAEPSAELRVGIRPEDIDAALAELNETFEIGREDLDRILRRIEAQALIR
jgi:CBS domain-containing membrane protein